MPMCTHQNVRAHQPHRVSQYFSADELEYTALGLATYTTIYGHGFWHQASWLKTWAPLGADNAWTDLNNGELLTAAISAVLVKSILEAMVSHGINYIVPILRTRKQRSCG